MNTMLKAALAAVLVAGVSQAAHADLTHQGAVGLPLNPTAQIPNERGARLQADYFDFGGDLTYIGAHAAGLLGNDIEINGGISSLSVDGLPDGVDSEFDETGFDIGAKYLFTRETDPAGIRVAAGAGYSSTLLDNTYVYLVGTKYLGDLNGERLPITGHLGLRYDRFDFILDTSSQVSVYGGVEVPVTRDGSFTLVGELQSPKVEDGEIPYSASLRFRPRNQGVSASIGLARQGFTDENGFFAQLGISFATD